MTSREYSPADTREQAEQIIEAWKNLGPSESLGGMTLTEFTGDVTDLGSIDIRIKNLEDQLTDALNQRKTKRHKVWNNIKRTRSSVKGNYGDDSSEYERFGGTRLSERKPAHPTAKTPPPAEG